MTRVVNLYHEPYEVYIGRPGKGQDGYFGNPFVVGQRCQACNQVHGDGASTLTCFKSYFDYRLEHDDDFRKKILSLKGKTLGCFCKNKNGKGACHGDVIVSYLEDGNR